MKNMLLVNHQHLSHLKERSASLVISFFIVSTVFQARSNDSDESDRASSSSDEEEFADELDRYLSSGRIKAVDDPLKWWHENQGSYPRLSRMAKDFLTIPGQFFFIAY